MLTRFLFLTLIILATVSVLLIKFNRSRPRLAIPQGDIVAGVFDSHRAKTDAQWRAILTKAQYHILREQGTEIPFTGALDHETRPGTYYSVGCDVPLFRSEDKYDSGTGWPSFTAPIATESMVLRKDSTLGVERIEVLDVCGGHLGHVFNDGPPPTGKRYCMNSQALRFVPDAQ